MKAFSKNARTLGLATDGITQTGSAMSTNTIIVVILPSGMIGIMSEIKCNMYWKFHWK